jgi:hypothetical protein
MVVNLPVDMAYECGLITEPERRKLTAWARATTIDTAREDHAASVVGCVDPEALLLAHVAGSFYLVARPVDGYCRWSDRSGR